MRPGLSADDIYIMVEDEFLSAARAFTQHLHHAEYTRLKRLAQQTHQISSISDNIARPTDSITAMRAETKKRKEAEAREARSKTAVEKITGKGKRPESDSDNSELEEFAEKDKHDAPWSGTVLQGFMSTSPTSTGAPSLTGLQGVKSSTRAAAGYSKPVIPQSSKPFNLAPKTVVQPKPSPPDAASTNSSDDDDLDAPLRVPTIPPAKKLPETPTRKAAESVFRRASTKFPPLPPTLTHKPKPNPSASGNPTPKRATFDLEPEELRPERSDAARRRLHARREREGKGRGGDAFEREGGVSEIPVFLV